MISKIEISHKTIIFTVFFLIGIWFLVQIKDILFLLFISFILMAALRPWVDGLMRVRVPRIVAILLVYIIVFGVFGLSLAGTIPSLIVQSGRLIQELPTFVARVMPYWDIDVSQLSRQIAPIGESLVKVTVGVFSNIVTTLAVLVLTFYFLLERKHGEMVLVDTLGEDVAKRVIDVVKKVESRLGSWMQGQLFLMAIIGVLVYGGLTVLRVEFALPLAILAGFLEIIPMIGPIVSAIPAVLVALAVSPFLALSVVALYFIIQQVENNIIVPQVIRRSVGLSPLVTIVALMIGGKLAGTVGAILSVPIFVTFQVIVGFILSQSSKSEEKIGRKNPSS